MYVYSPSVAINHEGKPVAAWTSRLYIDSEVVYSAWIAYQADGGAWTAPILVDDALPCENASSIAVDHNGVHHLVRDSGPAPAYPGEIIYYVAGESPEPPVTTTITPESGGTIQSDSGDVQADFPPGSVSQDVKVTYAKASSTSTRGTLGIKFFELSAKTVSDGTPVTSFLKDYTLTLFYEGISGSTEKTLRLYYWDENAWIHVSSSVLDTEENKVTATLNHMTLFALMGEGIDVYLPLIIR